MTRSSTDLDTEVAAEHIAAAGAAQTASVRHQREGKQARLDRNRAIRAAVQAGAKPAAIAAGSGISVSTIWYVIGPGQ